MKIFATILFSFFLVSALAQKVDTVLFKYFKYSVSSTEEVSVPIKPYRKGLYKTDTIYKLGNYELEVNQTGKDSSLVAKYEFVTKQEYEIYMKESDAESDALGNCKPCWQKYYNKEGVLVREGLYTMDCPIGETRTYDNKTGKLKTKFYYRKLSDAEKSIFKNRWFLRTGEWIYFKPDGSKEKIEKYKDDVLIETIKF